MNPENMMFDIKIAGYILNSNENKYSIENLVFEYLGIEFEAEDEIKNNQISIFEEKENKINQTNCFYVYAISKLYTELSKRMNEIESFELFNTIEMPLVQVLADMQYTGIYIDKNELLEYGKTLQRRIEEITSKIYEIAGIEFNINSPKHLGEMLFEKLKLPVYKKTKNGYSTDVDVL